MRSTLTAGLSPLDLAHEMRLAGNRDEALRSCLALLEAAPGDLGPAALLAELLLDADRSMIAGEVADRLVDGFVRRGDLPSAVAATTIATRAGEDARPLIDKIGAAFGRGSKRLADDAAPAPPPLPKTAAPGKKLARLAGDALMDAGEAALHRLLASDDPVSVGALPKMPLFSALKPPALTKLLVALEVRDLATDEMVVRQGEEGREAFVVVRGMLQAVRTTEAGEEVTLAALGPGAIFGEMALVSDAPRAASVVAVEPTRVLVAPREVLEKQAGVEPAIGKELGEFCRARMVSNLIRHSAILGAVQSQARAELMARFDTRTFQPGEALVVHGEETRGLFLIASGLVEVTGRDDDGDRLQIATLGPGDVVGEISLVLRRPATADVVATHTTIALELSRDEFHQAIKEHPALLAELYELATKREEETRSVVAQEALDVEDVVLL
jgi:cAMP-dependent protein kinase regulator